MKSGKTVKEASSSLASKGGTEACMHTAISQWWGLCQSDRAVAGRAAEEPVVLCCTEQLQHSNVAVARLLVIGCAAEELVLLHGAVAAQQCGCSKAIGCAARSGCSTAVWPVIASMGLVYGVWPESRERHATPNEHHWVRSVHFTADVDCCLIMRANFV
jgi:hypothetical protein